MKVRYEDNDGVKEHAREVDEIMEILGIEVVYVSDRSQLSDFYFEIEELGDEVLNELYELTGTKVTGSETVLSLAESIRAKRNPQ